MIKNLKWYSSLCNKSGALKVYNYPENGQKHLLNQILFDSFVLEKEKILNLNIEPYEIDSSNIYHIKEINREFKIESLGEGEKIINLRNGIYPIDAKEWSGNIKVEVIDL